MMKVMQLKSREMKTLAKIWLMGKVNARLIDKACIEAGLWMSLPQEKRGLRTCH